MSKPRTPTLITLPVPPEYDVQWPPPSRSIPDPISVPGPAPVPVPWSHIDLPPGDPKLDSQSLPVPLECTEQCQPLSVPNDEQITDQIIVPDPALVPAPEHGPDLHSRDPNQDPLSSSGLVPLPASVREMDPSELSGSSTECAALQPVPELVMVTCEPITPTTSSSCLSQSPADKWPMNPRNCDGLG
ncbi:tetra-peptide repeat homeobox protein 1-like [Macrobrachium rosenbergii]|uniref:tetra-peptide repeat homeobox protein 1-like n=1 Tax=Macrobrachium rosenbergii TaxID=79674 RepID=UPI0034D52AFC